MKVAAKVIIVGGGFAGLSAAKKLGGKKQVTVQVFDRRNHHLFQPLLYQVATAALSPAEIAVPIRSELIKFPNVEVFLGNVDSVDIRNSTIFSGGRTYSYDYLILGCGSSHSYFGHNDWEEYAPGLKTLEQATEIRRRVLTAFEKAEVCTDENLQRELLTFVVVGGGPTGVELAGALAEISTQTLVRDFKHVDPNKTKVILVEGGPRILSSFSEKLSKHALESLQKLGVTVLLNSFVTQVDENGIMVSGDRIRAATVIWAAGVEPSPLNKKISGVQLDPQGRVKVQADLSVPGYPNVFVIGDQAHCSDGFGKSLPGLAPVAMQQGRLCAENILRTENGHIRMDFTYLDKGTMSTIGRRQAVAQIGRLEFSGFVAWILWLAVHILYLIGFKNRLFVIAEWAWSYCTFKRGARLIVEKEWRTPSNDKSTS